jgi:hypothetical protein
MFSLGYFAAPAPCIVILLIYLIGMGNQVYRLVNGKTDDAEKKVVRDTTYYDSKRQFIDNTISFYTSVDNQHIDTQQKDVHTAARNHINSWSGVNRIRYLDSDFKFASHHLLGRMQVRPPPVVV